jgi:hypothetical protein
MVPTSGERIIGPKARKGDRPPAAGAALLRV